MAPPSQLPAHPASSGRATRVPLIVFSHLRWGFVFQRPQHLLTRLSKYFDVYVVEEPEFSDGPAKFISARPAAGVEVLTPWTPERAPGFDDLQLPWIAGLLQEFVVKRGIVSPVAWLYTPMALPLLERLAARAVVYDCMDDLASFKFAPAKLLEREVALLQCADVVLTGGPSLYEARRSLRSDIQCLPSAVDTRHFSSTSLVPGSAPDVLANTLHADMLGPRLGFFGVIDERVDIELIAAMADLRPSWHFVMAGPVVKIDPATLPQRANIHWIGMQGYETLPYLLAQWDVAILPFALNEATRFISPTKTLEYLAGGRPVVSTSIQDVVSLYGSVVQIASTAEEFIAAATAAMSEPAERRHAREHQAAVIMARSTWDIAAERVRTLLLPYMQAQPTERATAATMASPMTSSAEHRSAVSALRKSDRPSPPAFVQLN